VFCIYSCTVGLVRGARLTVLSIEISRQRLLPVRRNGLRSRGSFLPFIKGITHSSLLWAVRSPSKDLARRNSKASSTTIADPINTAPMINTGIFIS
jgi:hypothetical protein